MKNTRDSVLDFMRGHYLLSMFFGHMSYYVGNSLFTFYEGNSSLWASPAEGFVFLSGVFALASYNSKIIKHNLRSTFLFFWKKAAIFYALTVVLTLLYTILAHYLEKGPYVGNGFHYTDLPTLLFEAITLQYNYSWADLTQMYFYLFLLAPVIGFMFSKKLWMFVLGLSLYMWSTTLGRNSCEFWCVSFFEVSAWQFLFVLGMVAYNFKQLFLKLYVWFAKHFAARVLLYAIFGLTTIGSVADYFYKMLAADASRYIHLLVNKENLGIGRLVVFFVWFAFIYHIIKLNEKFLTSRLDWLYGLFGRNSLDTYIVQSAVLFGFFYLPLQYSFWKNTLYIALATAFVWVILKVKMQFKVLK